MNNISVIGSGTMGNGIAHVFAQHGHKVSLIDISSEALTKALETIEQNLERQVQKQKITKEIKAETIANISTFTEIEDGALNADLVVEAATENIDLKLDIFKRLDNATPPATILASNTSSISITKIAAVLEASMAIRFRSLIFLQKL